MQLLFEGTAAFDRGMGVDAFWFIFQKTQGFLLVMGARHSPSVSAYRLATSLPEGGRTRDVEGIVPYEGRRAERF